MKLGIVIPQEFQEALQIKENIDLATKSGTSQIIYIVISQYKSDKKCRKSVAEYIV